MFFDVYIAINQHGQTWMLPEPRYPRKQLLAAVKRKRCEKMWQDTKDGVKHVGYITGGINGDWWTIYRAKQEVKNEV